MKTTIDVAIPENFGDANLERLKIRLMTLTGESVQRMRIVYDNSLIGGFVVRYHNHVYDASLKTRLEQVRGLLATGE